MSATTFSDHTAARMVDVDTAGEWLHWEAGGWWEKAMPMFALHCGPLDGH